mgnify:CR=1 FL=1
MSDLSFGSLSEQINDLICGLASKPSDLSFRFIKRKGVHTLCLHSFSFFAMLFFSTLIYNLKILLNTYFLLKSKKCWVNHPAWSPNVKNHLITSGNSVVIIILQIYFLQLINFLHFLLYTIQYTITNCRSQVTATFSSSGYYNRHITFTYNFLCLNYIYKAYRHSNYKYRFYFIFFY